MPSRVVVSPAHPQREAQPLDLQVDDDQLEGLEQRPRHFPDHHRHEGRDQGRDRHAATPPPGQPGQPRSDHRGDPERDRFRIGLKCHRPDSARPASARLAPPSNPSTRTVPIRHPEPPVSPIPSPRGDNPPTRHADRRQFAAAGIAGFPSSGASAITRTMEGDSEIPHQSQYVVPRTRSIVHAIRGGRSRHHDAPGVARSSHIVLEPVGSYRGLSFM